MENEQKQESHETIFENGIFKNPWKTWNMAGFNTFLKWRFCTKNNTSLPSDPKILDKTLPIHNVTDEEIEKFINEDTTNNIKLLWIGHATSLINMENCIILIDPVFSHRCSPSQNFGPQRFRDVPITVDRIPRVDAVIISHNHYDHLDYNSVMQLKSRPYGSNINWFVGFGLGDWFKSCGIENNVHELKWWQEKEFKNLRFIFTCAQHWSARGLLDRNKTLWGSWTILGKKRRFFFAGDTGYCTAFGEIGKKYGPFDLATIPIGAYEPRFMMQPQHVDPKEAVQIHIDIKSKKSIGVHWGTFALAYENYLEPKSKLVEELESQSLNKDSFITIGHGETTTCDN